MEFVRTQFSPHRNSCRSPAETTTNAPRIPVTVTEAPAAAHAGMDADNSSSTASER
ncbi:hypothetical protein SAMN05442782_9948 [Streptomyces sp. OK228]|nr:hypothetical protein SAMN05442782_9948 [Streptomyces sp. OK228]